jgi:hypothetical protein
MVSMRGKVRPPPPDFKRAALLFSIWRPGDFSRYVFASFQNAPGFTMVAPGRRGYANDRAGPVAAPSGVAQRSFARSVAFATVMFLTIRAPLGRRSPLPCHTRLLANAACPHKKHHEGSS